jgi:hypothetical protein
MRLGKYAAAASRARLDDGLRFAVAMAVVVVLAAAIALGSSARKVTAAKESAYAFVVGVRTGNWAAAKASSTDRLRGALDAIAAGGPSDPALAQRLEKLRVSQSFSGTFNGTWDDGCVSGKLDDTTYVSLGVVRVDATWQVDDVQVGAGPVECPVRGKPLREIHYGL